MKTRLYSIISIFISCLHFSSCITQWDFDSEGYNPHIVVEGGIENGEFAYVCLTRTQLLNDLIDEEKLKDIVLIDAKVIVSDGTQSEVLKGQLDTCFLIPYVYKGSEIRGEAGKTYTLTIEYDGDTLTSSTTIPCPVPLDNLEVSRCEKTDTLYQIKAHFKDNRSEKNYYKFFTRTLPDDKRFFASFLGTFDDTILASDGNAIITVNRGAHYANMEETEEYPPFFTKDETVIIKFTHLPKEGFWFWCDYENEVTNRKNIFFPNNKNLRSNIKGGYGVWCGYGTNVYEVNIHQFLTNK